MISDSGPTDQRIAPWLNKADTGMLLQAKTCWWLLQTNPSGVFFTNTEVLADIAEKSERVGKHKL